MLARRAHRKAVRRRWVKRTIVGGALLLVVGAGVLYVGRGRLTRTLALARLESALGYDAACASAQILPNGHVSLPGLALRARGVEGEAGEILVAERVELSVDWARAVFDPDSAVTSVRLIDPVFRVSVDVETGVLNLGTAGGGGAGTPPALPPVSVEGARLVFGENGPDWFAPLHEIAISGFMRRDPNEEGVYAVRLTEDAIARRAPAVLQGEIDLRHGTGTLALRDVDFDALRARTVRPRVETLLRRLRIGGRLPLATLNYASDGSFLVGADLTSVDVLAPVPVRNPTTAGVPDRLMSLSGVTGRLEIDQDGLHANFVGLFEDLDARVIIETEGLRPDADASAEIVISDYRWGPTPGLLPFAPELAAEFVQRFSGPEATINGRVRLTQVDGAAGASGLFTWQEGSAAFEDFAYPLLNVAGRMTFDNDGVYLTDLRAVGPSGADIRAEVTGAPLGNDAEIEARIIATNVPADAHLFDAIGGERGAALATLFTGETSEGITPGGTLTMEIDVYKRGGELGPWGWDVRAKSPELGISAARLGYPLRAREFAVTVSEEIAEAEIGEVLGPTGLRGTATVVVPMDTSDGPTTGTFELEHAPIDSVLVDALREARPAETGAIDGWRFEGTAKGRGEFLIGDEAGPQIAGDFGLHDVGVWNGSGVAIASGLNGSVRLGLDGNSLTATTTGPSGAQIELTGGVEPSDDGWWWWARADAEGVPLADETRRWVSALSSDAGRAFGDVLEEWGLGGTAGGWVILRQGDSDGVGWSVGVQDFENATLTLGGERVGFEGARGAIGISDDGVRFESVRATALVGGATIGEMALDGLTPGGGRRTRLTAAGRGVTLGSGAVRALATKWAGESVSRAIGDADPAGVADLSVEVIGEEDGTIAVSGRVEPRTLEITRDGARTAFTEATGSAVFDTKGLAFEDLRLHADGWDLLLDGAYEEEGGFTGEVDLSAREMTPGLMASLPEEAAAAASGIGLEIGEGGELWVTGDVGGESELVIGFTKASFELGAPVDRASGRLTLRRDGEGGQVGELELESFRAATVPMRAGRASLVWDDDAGVVDVPSLTAECAGGVIRGRARLSPAEGLGDEREFLVDVRCADVPLAWIVERPEGEPKPEDNLPERGLIGGQLRVRGIVGGDGSRRVGRGIFTINGGEVLRLPLLTPVFELMNLQPPRGERLNDAAIEFGVAGDVLIFDRLYVQSDSLVVSASGEARLDDGTLDLAVRTRGRTRVPLVSDLIDAFKDELLGARISGPIRSPEYELVQLPNAGRVLLGVLAPGAGGRVDRAAPPERPELADHVPSTLEPLDE